MSLVTIELCISSSCKTSKFLLWGCQLGVNTNILSLPPFSPLPHQITVAETAQEERNAVHTGGPLWSQWLLRTPIPHTVASANSSGGGKRLSRERGRSEMAAKRRVQVGPWIDECYYLMPAQVLFQDLNKVTKADFLRSLCSIRSKTNIWETKMGVSLILMYWRVAAKTTLSES